MLGTQNGDVDRNGPRVGTSRECAPPEAPGGSSEDTQPTLEPPGGLRWPTIGSGRFFALFGSWRAFSGAGGSGRCFAIFGPLGIVFEPRARRQRLQGENLRCMDRRKGSEIDVEWIRPRIPLFADVLGTQSVQTPLAATLERFLTASGPESGLQRGLKRRQTFPH